MTVSSTSNQNTVDTGELVIYLKQNPRYRFSIDLDGAAYQFTIHWNTDSESWYLDLAGLDNTVDYKGIRLSTGPNLLRPFAILELGALYVIDQTGEGLDPDYDNVGTRYNLYYVPRTVPEMII